MNFDFADILLEVIGLNASDLHMTAGAHPMVREKGRLRPLEHYPVLNPQDTREIVYSILNNDQRKRLETDWQIDLSYSVPGKARFRVNAYFQRAAIGAVLRTIPQDIPHLDTLGMPPVLMDMARKPRGFVLVTGPTKSGKSTTLAAMIDRINEERHEHIMTVEDPIEFLHRHKNCVVNQRELGSDAHSFSHALKAALRQDPDVILVGEMRDLETMETALTAAETGHLVLSTLHTLDATETVTRIVSSFPSHQQKSVRIQLAGILKAVISMRLVRSAKGSGRGPAGEGLVFTGLVRDYIIKEEKTYMICEGISNRGPQYSMQDLYQSLFAFLQTRQITYEEAIHNATNPDEFKMRVSGIFSTDQAMDNGASSNFFKPDNEEFERIASR